MASVSSSLWNRLIICSIVRDWYSIGGGSIFWGCCVDDEVAPAAAAFVVVEFVAFVAVEAGVPNNDGVAPEAGAAAVVVAPSVLGVWTGSGALAAGVVPGVRPAPPNANPPFAAGVAVVDVAPFPSFEAAAGAADAPPKLNPPAPAAGAFTASVLSPPAGAAGAPPKLNPPAAGAGAFVASALSPPPPKENPPAAVGAGAAAAGSPN